LNGGGTEGRRGYDTFAVSKIGGLKKKRNIRNTILGGGPEERKEQMAMGRNTELHHRPEGEIAERKELQLGSKTRINRKEKIGRKTTFSRSGSRGEAVHRTQINIF